jgi:hypothetical protein
MKTKNLKSGGKKIINLMVVFSLASGLFISCKKEASRGDPQKTSLNEIASILKARIISGEINAGSDEKKLILSLNNGNRFVIIDKLPHVQTFSVPSVPSGAVLISEFGVVVKNSSNNQTWLMVNNDAESIKKFEEVKKLLGGDCQISLVYGTMVVNPPTP